MPDRPELISPDSPSYREFTRLYRLARSIRPTPIDRWNGQLYAMNGDTLGGFDHRTGSIKVNGPLVFRYLTGRPAPNRRRQAQALSTVLHEATHAGMTLDAPAEPNAVRTNHSLGLTEGLAELRAAQDFQIFAELAGYPGLVFTEPQYEGAFIATESLLKQASGLRVDSEQLIDRLAQGPGVMHFDQIAEAVLQNRLAEVVPFRTTDRTAVRAALIETMLHPQWATLIHRPADSGRSVANEIGQALNSKLDELRRHYRSAPRAPWPTAPPNADADRAPQPTTDPPDSNHLPPELRFLAGVAPAADATRRKPVAGDGSRRSGHLMKGVEKRWISRHSESSSRLGGGC
ncbi:hypothetical protein EV646_11818 [Kribbella antiqua]|uniref:Uncharacterized protein n=1 Tax=Kribbella antiqua TaxID=2512217 RepID=A0A4R2I748_9ACTN|nr:hypothetical protein EV646_11818 [Kribbella antiqua]